MLPRFPLVLFLLAGATMIAPAQTTPPAAPFSPQVGVTGGTLVPLYPPDSPRLKRDRVREPETYTGDAPGRIVTAQNIHNPTIEFHPAGGRTNTGAAVILIPGGGHKTLYLPGEFVPYFQNHGIAVIILLGLNLAPFGSV